MVLRSPSGKDLAQIAQQSWRRLQHVELEVGTRRFEVLAAPLAKLLDPGVTPALESFTISDWYDHVEGDAFVRFFRIHSPVLARLVLFPGVERTLCYGNWTELQLLTQLLLDELKQPRRALEILELMVQADPSDAGPFGDLGSALAELGQRAKAVKMLEHSLELDASDDAVRYNLANLLRKLGKLDEALEHIDLALDASPADPANCHVKAKILDAKGDRRAKTWYRRALDLYRAQARADGEDPATLLQLACVHAGLGEDEAAFEALHRAIAADPLQADDAKADGDLARLRRDPRFSKLVAEPPPPA
jgi:tetratricopeptide (TPR) repeat protein